MNARRTPEQIIEHLEKLVASPNLAADVGPVARQEFVKGVNQISAEVFQLHTRAQHSRALLRVDIALTQLRNAATAATDDRMKALEELRKNLTGTLSRLNVGSTSLLQDPIQGFRGELSVLGDPSATAAERTRAGLLLASAATVGIGGGILAVRALMKQRPANEKWWKKALRYAALPAVAAGVFLIGMAGRSPREPGETPGATIVGPERTGGSIAGVTFERLTPTGATAPETVIVHNGAQYRISLQWPPAAATGGGAPPPPREDNWSPMINTIIDRSARAGGGAGFNFAGGFGPFGGQGETRIELAGLQQIAAGMPAPTSPSPPATIAHNVTLRFNLNTMGADQRLFVQEQIRAGVPVSVGGTEVRVLATVLLRRVGVPSAPPPAPAYPAIPDAAINVQGGAQTIDLGTLDPTVVSLSGGADTAPAAVSIMPGTGTPSISRGIVTATRNGTTLSISQVGTAPAGFVMLSVRRDREIVPRNIRVNFGAGTAPETAVKPSSVTLNATGFTPLGTSFPTGALTFNGTEILAGGNQVVGQMRISRNADGTTVNVEPANRTDTLSAVPLAVRGSGFTGDYRVSYVPVAPPVALNLPPAINFGAATRTIVLPNIPAGVLRANGVELRADASDVPVGGKVKISRDATARTMTIAVLDESADITDFDLRVTGTDIDRTTRINYRRPFVIPPTVALNDGTRSREFANVPQVQLMAGSTPIPVDAVDLPVGPLKITRNNAARTMTISPREAGVPISGHVLNLTADGISVSTTVSYAPPPGELPTTITLDSTNSSREITAVPDQALTATVNGTAVPVPVTAANLDVGGGLKITRNNAARTLTIAPLNAANRVPAVALTLGGAGLTPRTTTVSYAPPAADIEMTFPAAITLAGSPPTATIDGLPNRRLTLNTTTNIDVGGTATVGDLVFTRAGAPGASITITPRLPRTAVPGATIRVGGTGVTERATTVTYTPPPLPAAAELPGTINLTGDPPRMVIPAVPAVPLTATVNATDTPLPLTAANVEVGGNLKITRDNANRRLTIEPVNRRLPVNAVGLSIGGTDLTTRTGTVNYVPPPPSVDIPANASLTGTPPRLVVNDVPAEELRLNPGNVALPTTASNVRFGDMKISRDATARTMTIVPADIDTPFTNFAVEFAGTGVTARTSRISYAVPDVPAFTLPGTLTVQGAPPTATVNDLPERLLMANTTTALPVNATDVRVGDLLLSRTNNGRTLTIKPFAAATAVTAYALRLRGTGLTDRTTTVSYAVPVAPALPAIPAGVDLRGDDQTHTLRGIPDGRLEIQGNVLAVNDTLYLTSAGASVAATATNVAVTISRLPGGNLQFTASPDVEFTLRIRIRRNGDAADQNFNFHYTP